MTIRSYHPEDYAQLKALYLESSSFGGSFDEARDGEDRLRRKIEADPDDILVAACEGEIIGTVSIIDDGRVAWLFRFAVPLDRPDVEELLHHEAVQILRRRGHHQLLVYAPSANHKFVDRYTRLGFAKGGDYTCFWEQI